MKRFLGLLVFLLPSLAYGQGPSSAQIEAAKGIVKLYTTAGLPATCAPGQRVWDTTANATKVCANDGVTWSSISFTGGTITSPILAPAADNCASVPYSFTGDTNTGLCSSAADTLELYVGGVAYGRVNAATGVASRRRIQIGDYAGDDKFVLDSGSAGVGWQRNGSTAQEYHWAYSYTDASNFQGGVLKTSASGIEIAAETAGSGADNLDITLTPAGTGVVALPGGTQILSGGGIVGASSVYAGAANALGFTGRSVLTSPADGALRVTNNAQTGGTFIEGIEQSTPSAPAANEFRLYAKDNGAGKTQLCVLFSSGAEQCFATQP